MYLYMLFTDENETTFSLMVAYQVGHQQEYN